MVCWLFVYLYLLILYTFVFAFVSCAFCDLYRKVLDSDDEDMGMRENSSATVDGMSCELL